MDACKRRNIAKTIAVFVLILGLGFMAYESTNIFHYWVDESPGPTYVMYDRTPLEIAGLLTVWLIADSIVAVLVYIVLSPL